MFKRLVASPVAFALLGLVASCVEREPEPELTPSGPVGSVNQEFRTGWHGAGHEEITLSGLTLVKSSVRGALVEANQAVDGRALCDESAGLDWFTSDCVYTKLRSEYHVDNCRVGEAFQSIRLRYRKLVDSFNPASPDLGAATSLFGSILHTVQDFFAHSNWVDLGRSDLLYDHGFSFPSVGPGSDVGGLRVLAEPLPAGWTVVRDAGSRVPWVWDGKAWLQGLITGTYADNEDPSICVPAASIPHGDPFFQGGEKGAYLAKDDPDSWHHQQAVDAATDQTIEELCRLDRLLRVRFGRLGHQLLLDAWIADDAGLAATCDRNAAIVASLWSTLL